MRRAWGVLALGLGLLAASVGRAGDGPEPVPPPTPLPGPAVNGGAPAGPVVNGGAPVGPALVPNGGAPCGGCCGPRRSCLEQLVGLFCYRPLPVPHCCRQCPWCCHRSCGCMPPPYYYFLGERCHEGHYYGSTCGGCGCRPGCGAQGPGPWPGVIPPPGNTISGVVPPPNLPFSARPQTPLPLPNQGPP